jgi:hypothetical protein
VASSVKVEVRGIRELQRAFKQVESGLPKALRGEFLGIAQRVASSAASRVERLTGRAASSIVPRASTRGASIAFGGQRAEHYPWLDFGGAVGRRRSIVRPVVAGGRYVYPAIAEHQEETAAAVDQAIERTAERVGFETRGSA